MSTENVSAGSGKYPKLDLIIRILKAINSSAQRTEALEETLSIIKEATGMEATGIRLRDGFDYPYYVTKGFPGYFVEAERFLCSYNGMGRLLKDESGNPVLECMCGNVIKSRTDPSLPFFTSFGSFWTNSTTKLLATTSEKERQARTRNRCNGEGYESVALIPLRSRDTIIGLLQLNDKRTDMFTPDLVRYFEDLGNAIGLVFAQKQMETELRHVNEYQKERMRELNCLYSLSSLIGPDASEESAMDSLFSSIARIIPEIWEHHGAAHVKISIFDREYVSDDFIETPTGESLPILLRGDQAGTLCIFFDFRENPAMISRRLDEKRYFLNLLLSRISSLAEIILVEKELRKSRDEMERRVEDRTSELRKANEALEDALAEKMMLIREVNHRVKNNLFILQGILELQTAHMEEGPARQIIKDLDNKVHSISMLHEVLYRSVEQGRINAQTYITSILSFLEESWTAENSIIRISCRIPPRLLLEVDKVLPVGLIINEAATNAFKYAFAGREEGEIIVSLAPEDSGYLLRIADDGIGMPEIPDISRAPSLGLKLIHALTIQLKGELSISREGGTSVTVRFP